MRPKWKFLMPEGWPRAWWFRPRMTESSMAIYGFGNVTNTDNQGNIFVGNVLRTRIESNVLGTTALSFSDPAGAPAGRSGGDNIRVRQGDNGIIRNNLIGWSNGKGIALEGATDNSDGAQGWTVTLNEVRNNALSDSSVAGLDIEHSGNATVQYNLFDSNGGAGIDSSLGLGGDTIDNNTSSNNGKGPGANVETPGIRLYSSNNTVSNNIIFNNGGAGVMVTPDGQNNVITRNSIYNNGSQPATGGAYQQIGIDLLEPGQDVAKGTPVAGRGFVTPNDPGDVDTGANGLLNFSVLDRATLDTATNQIVISGWAGLGPARPLSSSWPRPIPRALARARPSSPRWSKARLPTWTTPQVLTATPPPTWEPTPPAASSSASRAVL